MNEVIVIFGGIILAFGIGALLIDYIQQHNPKHEKYFTITNFFKKK